MARDGYRFGAFELPPCERRLQRSGESIPLGTRAFDLLLTLVQGSHRVLSKRELIDAVWPGVVVEENNLTVQVSALRRLLGPGALATVSGRGYRFTWAVELLSAPTRVHPVGLEASDALPLPDLPSIAVLPFTQLSGEAGDTWFCDGVTDDLITELSRFRSLFVIARATAFTYKEVNTNVRSVGRELGVRYILQGSIRQSGARVRVSAHLG